MSLIRTPAAMLAVLLLAGCAGHEPATGQVTGRLLSQGAGSPGQRPMPGTVAFTAAGQLSRFRALLAAPSGDCHRTSHYASHHRLHLRRGSPPSVTTTGLERASLRSAPLTSLFLGVG